MLVGGSWRAGVTDGLPPPAMSNVAPLSVLRADSPSFPSSQSIVLQSESIPCLSTLAMKDPSVASIRHARNSIYPKKRPSPHGVSKSSRSSATPLLPAHGPIRKTPRSAKSALIQQRQRELQIMALRREGILLEEEYREEIRYYMHDMEVCPFGDGYSPLSRSIS